MGNSQSPRFATSWREHYSLANIVVPDSKNLALRRGEVRDDLDSRVNAVSKLSDAVDIPPNKTERKSNRRSEQGYRANCKHGGPNLHNVSPPSAPELVSVTPRGKFRAKWTANANEFQSLP